MVLTVVISINYPATGTLLVTVNLASAILCRSIYGGNSRKPDLLWAHLRVWKKVLKVVLYPRAPAKYKVTHSNLRKDIDEQYLAATRGVPPEQLLRRQVRDSSKAYSPLPE